MIFITAAAALIGGFVTGCAFMYWMATIAAGVEDAIEAGLKYSILT